MMLRCQVETTPPLEAVYASHSHRTAERPSVSLVTDQQLMPSEPSDLGSRAVRVLIVDDSSVFQAVARELLEGRGYTVTGQAFCAHSAIGAIELFAPDAALIDVGLPAVRGVELAIYLRAHHSGVAVLLTSADPGLDGEARVEQTGAAGFVTKTQLAKVDLSSFWPVADTSSES